MKKILYVGAGAPWAGGGGGAGYLVRQGMLLRALAGLGELHFALFDFPKEATAPPFGCEIIPMRVCRGGAKGRMKRAWADLVQRLPRMVRDVDVERSSERLRHDELPEYDAVVAYRVDFAYFAGVLGHPRLLLDVDDPEHLRWRRRQESRGKRIDWRTVRDLEKLRRFEQDAVAGASRAFVCQEKERDAFPTANVAVVPNGVDVPAVVLRGKEGGGNTSQIILMLGNFSAGAGSANDDALLWFAKEIWPVIRRQCPTGEFHVVGRMSEEITRELSGIDGVRALGFVESLDELFASARLSVAPLRFGTGTRIKILDSFARACPVVSTTVGAEGLAITPGVDVLVADDSKAFAAHCVRLLNNEQEARLIGEAGRRLVGERYDRRVVERELRELFQEFLERSKNSQ